MDPTTPGPLALGARALLALLPAVVGACDRAAPTTDAPAPRGPSPAPVPSSGPAPARGEAPTHGLATGDVASDSAVLWARCAGEGRARFRVAGADGEPRDVDAATPAARDHTAKVTVTGLSPATRYQVAGWCEPAAPGAPAAAATTAAGPPGSAARAVFRTAPRDDQRVPVRFAWSGDLGGQNVCRDAARGYPIFEHLRGESLDFFLALGDMIYADNPCQARGVLGNTQVPRGVSQAATLPGFWEAWRYNRGDAGYRALLAATSTYAVWDDHEVVNDFGPDEATRTAPPYQAGVSLLPAGRQALLDWNPIREDPADPTRLYRARRWGRHVELLMLDTRQYRDRESAPDLADRPKSLLGEAQRRWLGERLAAPPPTWTLVASSVPVAVRTGHETRPLPDGWASGDTDRGYERELAALFRELRDAGRRDLVFLTTDVHFAAVYRHRPLPDDAGFVVHELVVGPLSAGLFPRREFDRTFGTELLFFHGPARWEDVRTFDAILPWLSFGEIEVSGSGELLARIRDGEGRVVDERRLTPGR